MPNTCPATYFDGMSAAKNFVELSTQGSNIIIRSDTINLVWPLSEVRISEQLGSAARSITNKQGGFCEISDLNSLENLLNDLGLKKSALDYAQHSYGLALASAVFLVLFIGLGSWFGLPIAAKQIAMRLPASSLQVLDSGTLATLDKYILKPSKLSKTRQNEISNGFSKLVANNTQKTPYNIVFRNAEEVGPNAFALPSGTIVMLDQLVELADDDKEVLGVLAHELGHVERRHSARMMLQTSISGLALTWWLGDVSTLLAAAPGVMLGAKYSRDMETEADEYAKVLFEKNNLSTCYLATLLQKLEASVAEKSAAKSAKNGDEESKSNTKNNTDKGDAKLNRTDKNTGDVSDFLSSHPATQARMKAMCPSGKAV